MGRVSGSAAYTVLSGQVDPMGKHFVNYETNVTEQGREFIITLNGSQQSMSIHDLEHMTLPEFARLWTVSRHSKASCWILHCDKPPLPCEMHSA